MKIWSVRVNTRQQSKNFFFMSLKCCLQLIVEHRNHARFRSQVTVFCLKSQHWSKIHTSQLTPPPHSTCSTLTWYSSQWVQQSAARLVQKGGGGVSCPCSHPDNCIVYTCRCLCYPRKELPRHTTLKMI